MNLINTNSISQVSNLKKVILTIIITFSFFIALRIFGFRATDFANFILRIPFTKIFLIISVTLIIAFCTYALLKISTEIEKQKIKHKILARKTQEIISIYLDKIKEYDFCKYYLDNNFLIEKLSKELKVSKEYFKKHILPYVKKDNLDYRLISYTDPKGRENNIWRLKNH